MKFACIQWAKANGYTTMGTTNDHANTGILAINTDLGFVPKPARIQIEKHLP